MHISKNAVVGKAHRLDLPARPSPIKHGTVRTARQRRPTCPPLTDLVPTTLPLAKVPAPITPRRITPAAAKKFVNTPCCWPIGEPSQPSFHFCGADSQLGKPYCAEHCGLAYRKPRRALECELLSVIDTELPRPPQGEVR
jgi:GcrA cell cycle regulator